MLVWISDTCFNLIIRFLLLYLRISTKRNGTFGLGFTAKVFFEHFFSELLPHLSFSISNSPNFRNRIKKLEVVPMSFDWANLVASVVVLRGGAGLSVGLDLEVSTG